MSPCARHLLSGAIFLMYARGVKRYFAFLALGILFLVAGGVFQAVRERVPVPAPASDIAAVGAAVKKKDCGLTPKPREFDSAPYYEGPLIDAHLHMPVGSHIVATVARKFGENIPAFGENGITIDYLNCLFKSEGIIKVIGFYLVTKYAEGTGVAVAKKFERDYPGLIVPFFMPPPMSALMLSPESAEKIFKKNVGFFKGYGEIALDRVTSGITHPEHPSLLTVYTIAQTRDMFVMMHPKRDQKEAVTRVLAMYPEVTFILHGGADDWITELFPKHKNLYYTAKAEIKMFGWSKRHRNNPPTRDEFLQNVRANFSELFEGALAKWKEKIEAYPERFMWETDRGSPQVTWTFDYEVGAVIEEFSRAFIGRLAPEVQEKFAYKNAEALLAGR